MPDLQVGSSVGGRVIEAEIGRGGMGTVYRARNERLGRIEALKVISEQLALDPDFRDRFLREARIAVALEHPNVIPVYDADIGSDGRLFIAMRYVRDGNNMSSLIRRAGRLRPELAADLIAEVAAALDAAHGQGLVHRDVKPANVLITGEEPFHAYLTDFGLSKQTTSESGVSRAGTFVGTVDYMSPEQARGEEVDARTDVYALGVSLYEALTGRVPYTNPSETARLLAKMEEDPPRPSTLAPGVPAELDEVLERALARDVDDRYSSAGELGRAARAAAGGRPVTVAPQVIGPGSVVADCLLEEVVGEGGMAVVYRAEQQSLGKTVAVKVMSQSLADDPAFRVRFEREWKVAAAIEHPNVVPIHWAGEAAGRLFIVMRFIEGGTLGDAIGERGRLEPDVAVEVVEQVASALDAAHARGLVHRDIKPGNILVEESTGRVYLTDFGLGKGVDDVDTDSGEVLGTARYMAPERQRGGSVDDVRGDVYSLGCVLWDMLAGPERVPLGTLGHVPPELAEMVDVAVSLEPSRRFRSAGELARAARGAIDRAGPIAGSETTVSGRTRPDWQLRNEPFAPAPLSTSLSDRVLEVCAEAERDLQSTGDAAVAATALGELNDVRHELATPARVALLGGSGSGRSALLSALIGRDPLGGDAASSGNRIGDLGIPVSLVAGSPERVTAILTSGGEISEAMTAGGRLPESITSLGADLAGLDLTLDAPLLHSVSLLLPPPGAAPPQPGVERAPDAFVVCVSAAEGEGAGEQARRMIEDQAGSRASAVNTTVALTKADLAGDAAPELAAEIDKALGPLVAAVTPVSGLLAEAANADFDARDDLALLGELAHLDPAEREPLLASEDAFTAGEPAGERRALLDRYGLAGIGAALELSDVDQLDGLALRRRLREISGVGALEAELEGFRRRGDALQADRELNWLEELSYRSPDLAGLRDHVEEARLDPDMHLIELLRVFERWAAGTVVLPEDLSAGLERLATAQSPAERVGLPPGASAPEIHAAAMQSFRDWKSFENGGDASPAAARAARVVARSFERFAREAEEAGGENSQAP